MGHIEQAFADLNWATFAPYLVGVVGFTAMAHFFRAWRWNNLLRPIGVELPPSRLLAISSVGYMSILVLPFRLGEFVRPALVRKKGEVSASAVLGTIAVERVVDGLVVSLTVFVAFFLERNSELMPRWMMIGAYTAIAIFFAGLSFLLLALRWPKATVGFATRLTLTPRFAPRFASVIEAKLTSMISGFSVLKDGKNLIAFIGWTLLYWIANGLSLWLLAKGFGTALERPPGTPGIELPLLGGIAIICWVAVGVSLPNTPALIGQYQMLMVFGMLPYVGETLAHGEGQLLAFFAWALAVTWYIGAGFVALATPYVSLPGWTKSDEEPSPPKAE